MRVTPAQSTEDRDNQIKNSYLHVCLPFDWYLQEVYPGLIIDAKGVNDKYAEYISTDYISPENGYIKKLIAQYTKSSSDVKSDNKEILMLMKREEQLEANIMQVVGAGIATLGHKLPSIKRVFKEPPPIKGTSRAELLDSHMERLKEELTCMDFPEPDHRNVCLKAINDNSEWCETNKADAIFVCPKSCGFCAIEDGKFCEDFYLRKCPVWKAHDQCETIDNEFGLVKDVCRKSCGVCTPHYLSTGGSSNNKDGDNKDGDNKDGDNKDAVGGGEGGGGGKDVKVIEKADTRVLISPPAPAVKPLSDLEKQQLKIDEMLKGPITVDPALLHTKYLNGNIPDVIDGTGTVADENSVNCRLRNKDDGKILDRITVADIKTSADSQGNNPPPVKIFCGIYTMEQSHATNAKATRNTWAKKCDGFIAFSTVDDPSFPSVNILHEGDEAYDNMWQKSRSIWKYIHAFLVDQYDFFLLGGDDMMYVIENLRAYLGSEEISRSRAERSGLFIGRVFQPPGQTIFNSGGAGYILDNKAVKILAENIDTSKCYPHQRGFWEDVNVANCLKKSPAKIVPYDTRDSVGRERFHPFNPGLQLTYRIPPNPDWYAKYNPDLKLGYECCSTDSISFHYLKEQSLYELYSYVYHCKKEKPVAVAVV